MNYTEKLGLLQRGLQRRVENYPKYVESGEREKGKIQKYVDEFNSILEQYKGDYTVRKQLQKDTTLIAMAGSKTKLKKILEDEAKFTSMVEAGRDEFIKNYGNERFKIDLLLEEAEKSLPDAELLLAKIRHNEIPDDVLEAFINLFLIPVLTDWKQYEEDLKKEQENTQDNIQESK